MKHLLIISIFAITIHLLTSWSCSKKQIPEPPTVVRTVYVRDTSLALCKRITDPDSAIVFMDHLFVPMYSNGIKLNRAVEQTAYIRIPGVTSKTCVLSEYYCQDYLVGRDVEVAFALFSHPTQLQEWRALSKDFTEKNREWNLSVYFSDMSCNRLPGLKIKNGIIIRTW